MWYTNWKPIFSYEHENIFLVIMLQQIETFSELEEFVDLGIHLKWFSNFYMIFIIYNFSIWSWNSVMNNVLWKLFKLTLLNSTLYILQKWVLVFTLFLFLVNPHFCIKTPQSQLNKKLSNTIWDMLSHLDILMLRSYWSKHNLE